MWGPRFNAKNVVIDTRYDQLDCKFSIERKDIRIYIAKMEEVEGIIIFFKKHKKYYVVGQSKYAVILLVRSIFVKFYFDELLSQGAYPMHCSAIRINQSGKLFVAESEGGKSTVYFSFAMYSDENCELITDDTVFVSVNEKVIGRGMPLQPSIRKGAIKHMPQIER
ncbi:MAG: hypothetical protein ACI4F1_09955 [Bariatricus sp.]